MKNAQSVEDLAFAYLDQADAMHVLTMFATIAFGVVNGPPPTDELLNSLVEGARSRDDIPEFLVECVEFLQMLRQTRQDEPQ